MTRRRFGSVVARKRKDGSVSFWLARYVSPVDPSKRVQRSFRRRSDAESWLVSEEMLVDLHRRGVQEWLHPTDRENRQRAKRMTFAEFADWFEANYRKRNGMSLRPAAKRNLAVDVRHLKDVFGDRHLTDITPSVIAAWYFGPQDVEHPWVFPRLCKRLRSILEMACAKRPEMGLPLLESNPFVLPLPPDPDPKSWETPPVTPEQLAALYRLMPAYDRLSVLLSVWTGGMRTGELCALRVQDFDLHARTMRVEHSVCRGEGDVGVVRLGPTKSAHSRRVCALPDLLVPLVERHIQTREDPSNPMLFQPRRGTVLSPTTLNAHFRRARDQAGCPTATFRTLRVTHTTLLLQHGGTLKEAMDSIGDSTQDVVLRHYARVIPQHQRAVVNEMANSMVSRDETLRGLFDVDEPVAAASLPCSSGMGQLARLEDRMDELFALVNAMNTTA